MPHNRATKTKQKGKAVEKKRVDHTEEHEEEELPAKAPKIIEIDEPEPVVGAVEEKTDDDLPVVTDDEDSLGSEEVGLDDEEVDPFGDKYEI